MIIETDEASSPAVRLQAACLVVSRVLSAHQEARSLLSEAGDRRVLAEQSTAAVDRAAAAADAARLRYEELRHLLDPRVQRRTSWWMALWFAAPPPRRATSSCPATRPGSPPT